MTSLPCDSKMFCLHLNGNNSDDRRTFIVVFSFFNFLSSMLVFLFTVTEQKKGSPVHLHFFCALSHLTKWTYNWKRPDSNIYFYARNINSHSFFFCERRWKEMNKWREKGSSCRRKTQPLWIIAWKWSAEYYKRVFFPSY